MNCKLHFVQALLNFRQGVVNLLQLFYKPNFKPTEWFKQIPLKKKKKKSASSQANVKQTVNKNVTFKKARLFRLK